MSSLDIRRVRKRPVDVEAVLFEGFAHGQNGFAVLDWILSNGGEAYATPDGRDLYVKTLEGRVLAHAGQDRIIHGTRNEFYPIKPAVYDDVYDDLGPVAS